MGDDPGDRPRMSRFATRTTLAALALAALTTACADGPMAPRSPATAKASNLSGYVVSWGRDGKPAPQPPEAGTQSGYVVSWGKKGQPAPSEPTTMSGYVVSWGRDGGNSGSGNTGGN